MFVSDHRFEIEQRLHNGRSIPEIARELGLAPTTVSYHAGRLAERRKAGVGEPSSTSARGANAATPSRAGGAKTGPTTRQQVAELLGAGVSRAEIARRLAVSKATVSYHARRLGQGVDERCARRYDWALVQEFHDAGHTVRECIAHFGFSSASWFDAIRRGELVARPAALPIEELCVADRYRSRFHLKARLIREGLKPNRCELCGVSTWRGQALTLALHHVNGVRDDNRLPNLQLLCPNCHSQTENFAGRRRV